MKREIRRWTFAHLLLFNIALLFSIASTASADPCGMVPPIYQGQGPPIVRVGHQQTFVFFKDGVETFVIRPGFSGKVDQFGMLIPFPTPPAIRKVPDNVFPQLAAAVDPPEVIVDLLPRPQDSAAAGAPQADGFAFNGAVPADRVRVLRREAVGMYEVAVLEAGSAAALKKWMDEHGYRFPDGMDKVCNEYVDASWCFVAVKTRVGQKDGVDPKPGQRDVDSQLPAGSTFDGFVQAMGFRFKTDELVVPMRLSAFNDGELRNIVYLLTDGPRRIRSIPEEYVRRQIRGDQLFRNVTDPLPVRIIGGTEKDLTEWHHNWLKTQRDPEPKNGVAKHLFAADLLAVSSGQLSLPQEESEKELLAIGEHFGLRGSQIDKLNEASLKAEAEAAVAQSLADVKSMTLTVVDGDFPRDVLSGQNLTFASYRMPQRRNRSRAYDANLKGPAPAKQGVLKLGAIHRSPLRSTGQLSTRSHWLIPLGLLIFGLVTLVAKRRRPR